MLFCRERAIFEKKDFSHPLLWSFCFAFVITLLCIVVNRFEFYYSTNDDYVIGKLLSAGEEKSLFLNYLLSFVLVRLYKWVPIVNWFVLIQVLCNFISLVCINYVFIKKFDRLLSTIIIISYSFLFVNQFVSIIQWTQTATILITSGYILFCYYLTSNNKRSVGLIFATLLVIMGAMIRYDSLLPVTIMFVIYIFSYWLSIILKKGFDQQSILFSVKKIASITIAILLVFGICFSTNYISEAIKCNDYKYLLYKEYNHQRSSFTDYYRASYSDNESFYKSIGIDSENDLEMLGNYSTDIAFFNNSRIKRINDYSNSLGYGKKFFVKYTKDKLSAIFSCYWFIIVPAMILFIGIIVFLIRNRNKYKIIFPIILLLIFIPYFFVFRFNYIFILALPIMAFVLLTGMFFNRYYFIQLTIITVSCLIIIFIMNFIRLNFRVAFNIFFPTIIILLGTINLNDIRYRFSTFNYRYTAIILGTVFLAFCMTTAVIICSKEEYRRIVDNSNIANYISENKDTLFVSEGVDISMNYDTPFITPYFNRNCISNGWSVGSATFYNKLKSYNIDNIFKDSVNNPKVKFVLDKDSIKLYKQYFNEHYCSNCSLIIDKDFGDSCSVQVLDI